MSKIILMMPDLDFYIYPYYDMFKQDNVTVLKRDTFCPIENHNKLEVFIHELYFHGKVTKFIPEFSRRIWYKKYINIPDTDERIYFWFWGFYVVASSQFRKYLKKHYPNCKIIFTLFDLVKWHLHYTKNFEKVKDFADVIFSYDIDDVEKYGLNFHRDGYSILPPEMLCNDYKTHDLNFCGLAKDRYRRILAVYDAAKAHGINCDFNVPKLPDEEVAKRMELSLSHYIPYLDYLKMIQNENCLLEISQGTSKGYSLRPWEAIAYGKKILSDNKDLLKEEFYDPRFIQIYDEPKNINWDWVKEKIPVDYKYIDKLSIKNYISDILKVVDNDEKKK